MGALRDALDGFMEDSTPDERARVFRLVYRLTVVAYISWALGLYASFGFSGVARAGDVQSRIDEALQPMKAQLGAIVTQLANQDEVLKSIRADQLATKLRELKRTCCVAGSDPDIKARMDAEIESTQREYRSLTGERYPLPECGA